jgi:RPA family protein
MKRKITFLLAALLLMSGLTWAQTITWTAADQGYENGQLIESITFDDHVSAGFFQGTNSNNPPRYYNTGEAIRCYGGNYFTITSDYILTEITLGFASGEGSNEITTDLGNYADGTWTGSANEVTFTIGGTSGHRRIATFAITYSESGTPNPTITAANVEIAFDATSGTIEYTINNAVTGGELTASTTADWLFLGTMGTTIPFTCTVNTASAPRMAAVTLTYTYNTDQTITKNVTVTQAANPDAVNNISDIIATGSYTVQGTIVAKSTRGFMVGDGTGYVYYYNASYIPDDYNIGDMVKLSGSVVVYGGVYEFNSSTTITAAETSNYVAEDPTIITGEQMDARVASTTPPQLSCYVRYEGTLSINGTHYNITNITGATTAIGSISYPLNVDEITALDGKHVKVTGYYVGISTGTYYNTMLGSLEEIASTEPSITLDDYDIEVPAEGGEGYINVTYQNIDVDNENIYVYFFDESGENYVDYDWIVAEIDDNNNVQYVVDANQGAARTAYFKVFYEEIIGGEPFGEEEKLKGRDLVGDEGGIYSNLVTVTQAGNPNLVTIISDITAEGMYTVQGTIVAINNRGFVLGDGTGYVYYYYGSSGFEPDDYAIGDMVKLSGSVVSYGGVFEFNNSTTITYVDESNYVAEEPTVLSGADMDARVASTSPAQLSSYIQYEGTLSVNGNYYNITNIAGATTAMGSISYPLNVEEITALDGMQVKVTGYYVGVSSSTYYNTMIGSIEGSTEPAIVLDNYEIEVPAEGSEGYLNVTYQNIDVVQAEEINVEFFDESGENYAEYDWITAEIDDNNNVYYVVESNQGEARTAYFKVYYEEGLSIEPDDDFKDGGGSWAGGLSVYSNLVTVYQAAYAAPGEWVLTDLTDLTEGDIFVIVGTYEDEEHDSYAMSNDNGTSSAPTAVEVTIVDNTLSGEIAENLQWTISGNATDGYTFYPYGSDEIWLYCTNSNNGVRVGTNTNNAFTFVDGGVVGEEEQAYYLFNTSTERYIGIYNRSDWRCYSSINNNIKNQSFAFYKKATSASTQTSILSQGWNWWSTYIEQEGVDGLDMLEEGLGDNGVTIRSQVGYTDYYAGYGWYGSLASINNESSYKIKADVPCSVAMTGTLAEPSQHPITLSHGWTWMGYVSSTAMDVNEALSGFEATEGDKLKSQQGYADYYASYGWYGSLNTIEPGMGLMYYSTNGEAITFTYPDSNRGGELKANLTAENNHWEPNVYAYPDNMTVMAVVELNEMEVKSDNYELAAFANGECRGSVRLTYAEPINRHVAFLTISGKDAAELSFRLYDTETGMEYYDAEESLDFVANAIIGEATDLYVVHFRGTTGMDEFASKLQIYPNPVNRGERFSINIANDVKSPIYVEIVNALGVVIETVYTSSEQTIIAPNVTGVFTLCIIIDGKGTLVRKLVVK